MMEKAQEERQGNPPEREAKGNPVTDLADVGTTVWHRHLMMEKAQEARQGNPPEREMKGNLFDRHSDTDTD